MPVYAYVILGSGWILWFVPFAWNGFNFKTPQKTDRRARWGIVLQAVAYSLLWLSHFWNRSPPLWQIALATALLVLANVLSWSATRALGRHLRFDAALGADHELVRSGPYRILRHPIYTSMLCILLGTGLLVTPFPMLALAILVFLAGTEIRARVEDGLLLSRFGERFLEYKNHTAAYIPLLR